jgi:hypothetical protein
VLITTTPAPCGLYGGTDLFHVSGMWCYFGLTNWTRAKGSFRGILPILPHCDSSCSISQGFNTRAIPPIRILISITHSGTGKCLLGWPTRNHVLSRSPITQLP